MNHVVYSHNSKQFYTSLNHKLAVCHNVDCSNVHGVPTGDYDPYLGLSNYDIWLTDNGIINANKDQENIQHFPTKAVCTECIDSYKDVLKLDTCAICTSPMPSVLDPNYKFTGVHVHKDTNYSNWSVCNTCANQYWKSTLPCFCGSIVHEVDLIRIASSNFNLYIHYGHHNLAWESLFVEAGVSEACSFRVTLQKGCNRCVGLMGEITEYGEQAFNRLFDDKDWSSLASYPLSQINIVNHNHIVSSEIKVWENPAIYSYVKNQNVGKIGYVTSYNEIF